MAERGGFEPHEISNFPSEAFRTLTNRLTKFRPSSGFAACCRSVAATNQATQVGNIGDCRINDTGGGCLVTNSSTKGIHVQAAAFDNAFQSADGNGFASMHCNDHLAAIFMTPFLVAPRLGNHHKTILAQNFDNFSCAANWIPPAHGTASSIILAPLDNLIGAGSNQSASASWAFAMASSSVSPAVAQPGNSGNTADQRLASESNSTSNRNFIIPTITAFLRRSKPTDKRQ
jgi:hypothetical protein